MDLFNEAEAVADPSVPEPTLEEAVGGYKRQAKARATREEILAGLPVIEVPCTVPDEDRNCPYCNTPMEVIGKKIVRENCGSSPRKWNGSVCTGSAWLPGMQKRRRFRYRWCGDTEPAAEAQPCVPIYCPRMYVPEILRQHPAYRQEADWKQMGVKLGRATLANWVIKCGLDYMEPVYERLHEHLRRGISSMRMKRLPGAEGGRENSTVQVLHVVVWIRERRAAANPPV